MDGSSRLVKLSSCVNERLFSFEGSPQHLLYSSVSVWYKDLFGTLDRKTLTDVCSSCLSLCLSLHVSQVLSQLL